MLNITVLILAYNEAPNIGFTLDSVVSRFDQVIVVDSFSDDETLSICKSYGEVEVHQHEFTHWATQRNWMLENCRIKNNWIFFLDADESVSEEFYLELEEMFAKIALDSSIGSIFVRKDFFFLGKHLKYSYAHPYIRLLFDRRRGLKFYADGAREYSLVTGDSLTLHRSGLHHEDRRGFDSWVIKHIKNADRECEQYYQNVVEDSASDSVGTNFKSRVVLCVRKVIWNNLPLGVRPLLYFCYRYFLKLGFLDGKVGFIFCINHALWYPMLIDTKIMEAKNSSSS